LTLAANGTISGTPTAAAVGTATFTVKATNSAGSDTKQLSLTISDLPIERTITTAEEWIAALSLISGNNNAGEYILTISGYGIESAGIRVDGTSPTFGTTATGASLKVTLKGAGMLSLNSQGYLLYIGARQTLIIDDQNLLLRGRKSGENGATQNNNQSVVYVAPNGTLELKNGEIFGNAGASTGGGVSLSGSNSTFTMRGGKITGNASSGNGGGVSVGTSGTFTIHSGEISDNSTGSGGRGGGVSVSSGGTFHIVTGTIYGSDAPAGSRNTTGMSVLYPALFIDSGIAQRGTFSGTNDAWVSKGDLEPDGKTIKVEDGEIIPYP
jgi:hypothetical protein